MRQYGLADYNIFANPIYQMMFNVDSEFAETHVHMESLALNEVNVAVKQKQLMATSFHPEITADNRWHALFVKMASECAPYDAIDEAAKAEATKTEIGLINPGGLPVFTDTVMAGPAYK